MKNVNLWRAGQKGGPAATQKGGLGLQKRVGRRAVERGNLPACPFLQPTLNVKLTARLIAQPGLLCSLPAHWKFMFFIWKHGPPLGVIRFSKKKKHWSHELKCASTEPVAIAKTYVAKVRGKPKTGIWHSRPEVHLLHH